MACENNAVNMIVEILNNKKASDISVLNVSALTTMADYFVIATGNTARQTQALCDNLEYELAKKPMFHVNKEGYRSGEWILLGFDDVIVHIFQPETRRFYDLEHVWQDAVTVDISELLN